MRLVHGRPSEVFERVAFGVLRQTTVKVTCEGNVAHCLQHPSQGVALRANQAVGWSMSAIFFQAALAISQMFCL
jgi:hypothetical protein